MRGRAAHHNRGDAFPQTGRHALGACLPEVVVIVLHGGVGLHPQVGPESGRRFRGFLHGGGIFRVPVFQYLALAGGIFHHLKRAAAAPLLPSAKRASAGRPKRRSPVSIWKRYSPSPLRPSSPVMDCNLPVFFERRSHRQQPVDFRAHAGVGFSLFQPARCRPGSR